MTTDQFNKKYSKWLEEGHYGLDIQVESVISALDRIFSDLTKIEGFSYSQIKVKFGMSRFYAQGVSDSTCYAVEALINRLLEQK